MKLFEITNEFENVFNQINEDGEITQEMLDNIDALQEDFADKAVSVAAYIKNIEAEAAAIKSAMDSMKQREARLNKQAESLKEYLQFNMQRLSVNEIKTSPHFKIKLKQCPPSVDVFDEAQVPEDYWREKVVLSIDKIKLKEALNEGLEIPGATIHRNIKLEIK